MEACCCEQNTGLEVRCLFITGKFHERVILGSKDDLLTIAVKTFMDAVLFQKGESQFLELPFREAAEPLRLKSRNSSLK